MIDGHPKISSRKYLERLRKNKNVSKNWTNYLIFLIVTIIINLGDYLSEYISFYRNLISYF